MRRETAFELGVGLGRPSVTIMCHRALAMRAHGVKRHKRAVGTLPKVSIALAPRDARDDSSFGVLCFHVFSCALEIRAKDLVLPAARPERTAPPTTALVARRARIAFYDAFP